MTKYVRLNAVHRARIESLHQLGHTQDEIAWQVERLNLRSVGPTQGHPLVDRINGSRHHNMNGSRGSRDERRQQRWMVLMKS